jgi:hypothetical protein
MNCPYGRLINRFLYPDRLKLAMSKILLFINKKTTSVLLAIGFSQ